MKNFWNYQKCGPKIHAKLSNIHGMIRKWQKFMICAPICIAGMFCLKPIFNSNYRFIYYMWKPWNSKILDYLVLFTHYYLIVLVTPIVYGCDFFYVSYSVHVVSQIYLLNRQLEKLEGRSSSSDIYEHVKHHQLMLS